MKSDEFDAIDDAVLIQRSRQGDADAFGMLVERYQDDLFNGIYRMLGDFADAADAAQDVFLKAYTSIEGFRGNASFYTWIYRIAVNTCISRRRSSAARKRHLHIQLSATENEDGRACELESQDAPPSQTAEDREEIARIEENIGRLPSDSRMVLVLKDIENYKYAEIAAMLGLSVGTVKSKLFRARKMLREMLDSQQ